MVQKGVSSIFLIIIILLIIALLIFSAIFIAIASSINPGDLSLPSIINLLSDGFRTPNSFVNSVTKIIEMIKNWFTHFSWWMFY